MSDSVLDAVPDQLMVEPIWSPFKLPCNSVNSWYDVDVSVTEWPRNRAETDILTPDFGSGRSARIGWDPPAKIGLPTHSVPDAFRLIRSDSA